MEIAIVSIVIITIVAMFWSVFVSKRLSIIVFSLIFIALLIAMVIWQGFTQQSFENIAAIAFMLFIIWFRFSKSAAGMSRASKSLEDNLHQKNYTTCKVCGKNLSYHRKPKKLGQLFLGGLTCKNCGSEFDVPLDAIFSR